MLDNWQPSSLQLELHSFLGSFCPDQSHPVPCSPFSPAAIPAEDELCHSSSPFPSHWRQSLIISAECTVAPSQPPGQTAHKWYALCCILALQLVDIRLPQPMIPGHSYSCCQLLLSPTMFACCSLLKPKCCFALYLLLLKCA